MLHSKSASYSISSTSNYLLAKYSRKATIASIKKIVSGDNPPESIVKTTDAVLNASNKITAAIRGSSGINIEPAINAEIIDLEAIPVKTSGIFDHVRRLLEEIIKEANDVTLDVDEKTSRDIKQAILSNGTYLLAETYKEKNADKDKIEKYMKELGNHILAQRTTTFKTLMHKAKKLNQELKKLLETLE